MIVAGFGFRAAATPHSLADALARAAGGRSVAVLATAADKAPALAALGAATGARVVGVGAAEIVAQRTLTHSAVAQATRGTGSLAEAAALAAAGRGGRLMGPRVVSADRLATCALAEGGGA